MAMIAFPDTETCASPNVCAAYASSRHGPTEGSSDEAAEVLEGYAEGAVPFTHIE